MRHFVPMVAVAVVVVIPLTAHISAGRSGDVSAVATAPAQSPAPSPAPRRAVLDKYCLSCHNDRLRTAGLSLEKADLDNPGADVVVWEKVLHRLRTREMPPPNLPRPDSAAYDSLADYLESALDHAAAAKPTPGSVPVRRLNRSQYANAIRDLIALDIDFEALLPADPAGAGFDNNAGTLTVSPMLLEQHLSVASKVSRLAIGDPSITRTSSDYQIAAATVQAQRSGNLPVGSRGGTAIQHLFPLDAEYVIKVRLQRGRDGSILAASEQRQLHIGLDGARIGSFTIGGPGKGAAAYGDRSEEGLDDALEVRLPVKAGPRQVTATFVKDTVKAEGVASNRQEAFFEGVGTISIIGPYDVKGPGDTPSRRKIFVCRPATTSDEEACAKRIVTTLARRAYRRPVSADETPALLIPYRRTREEGGSFEDGIRMALQRILASPNFIFRIEPVAQEARPAAAYRVGDVQLASRLSFFLWNSIPDDELLGLAERGELIQPAVLERQVRRMLADPRAESLVTDFVGQWLYLRNLESVLPDPVAFPDFDENLRTALQRETELFFESMLREDRSVLDLLRADYTFLNERLAQHYGIPGIYGSEFRRVTLTREERRGLLGQGSVLAVTSYPNRTSPTLRGKWLLENLLASPPPPPPPNVNTTLPDGTDVTRMTMRERLALHQSSPACSSCHSRMDPLGFALENFDGLGRWRDRTEDGKNIDVAGVLPDGSTFNGPVELRRNLLSKQDRIVTGVTERLLTYALGRAVEPFDMPAIRKIVRAAAPEDYPWSSLILGVVTSTPFQMAEAR